MVQPRFEDFNNEGCRRVDDGLVANIVTQRDDEVVVPRHPIRGLKHQARRLEVGLEDRLVGHFGAVKEQGDAPFVELSNVPGPGQIHMQRVPLLQRGGVVDAREHGSHGIHQTEMKVNSLLPSIEVLFLKAVKFAHADFNFPIAKVVSHREPIHGIRAEFRVPKERQEFRLRCTHLGQLGNHDECFTLVSIVHVDGEHGPFNTPNLWVVHRARARHQGGSSNRHRGNRRRHRVDREVVGWTRQQFVPVCVHNSEGHVVVMLHVHFETIG